MQNEPSGLDAAQPSATAELLGLVNGLVDISDSKPADEAQTLFARFMQYLPGLAWIKDGDGRYVFVNDAAERAFRRPRAELYHKNDAEIFPPETTAQFRANDQKALAAGTGVELIETLEHEDGLHYSLVSKFPIPAADGTAAHVGGMAIDITQRIQAEDALRAAREQLQLVADTMPAAVTRCSHDRRYVWVNRAYATWLGHTPEEIAGRPISEVIGPEAYETIVPYIERVLSGERVDYEAQLTYQGIGRRWISAAYVPTFAEGGVPDGWVAVVTDITRRKELEEALKEADRRKDEFLAMLAHELRNPLAPISNSLQLLRLSDELGPTSQRIRDIMEQQVNQMVHLVDDLLEVSRITRGKIELRQETVEVATIVCGAVELSRPLIEAAGHQLAISLPPDPIRLYADSVRLTQVVANLLNNAAKYTEPGGQVWLTARRNAHELLLSVRDTGVGIPAEMLPRVFDLFAQLDCTLSRAQGGLGIGLTLARSLVQMHGGQIEARSDGPGKGSEFVVRLPILSEAPRAPVLASQMLRAARSLPPRRILVVDDTAAAAFVLGKLLQKIGQDVHVVNDGPAALEYARQERPDVVISDIAMPLMDGYELARRLRQEPELSGTMLVALTGYGQEGDRQQAQEAGFDHHLVKPVSLEALYNLLASDTVKLPDR